LEGAPRLFQPLSLGAGFRDFFYVNHFPKNGLLREKNERAGGNAQISVQRAQFLFLALETACSLEREIWRSTRSLRLTVAGPEHL
jgi:hypothetical protein